MPETAVNIEPASPSQCAIAPAPSPAVQEALAAIWQDSLASPAKYLDDTVVPHGGE
jgi:hypothetical protein